MVAISGEHTLEAQARAILDQTGFSMPLSEQLPFFLRELWKPLAYDGNLVGIGVQDFYRAATGEAKGTVSTNWCFAENRDEKETNWQFWAALQNHNDDLVKHGGRS